MKPDPYNRFESLVKATVRALAIIAVALSSASDARSQSQPDDKNKQQGTKAPASPIGPTLPEGFKVAFDIGGTVRSTRNGMCGSARFFGQANQSAGGGGFIFSEAANNRRSELQMRFTF